MPVTWKISRHVVIITVKGHDSVDLRAAIIAAMSSPGFPPDRAALVDTRRETGKVMPDKLRLRAVWIATLLPRHARARCALVVGAKPHQYVLGRMLSVFLDTEGVTTEVFTSLRDARRWLTPANGTKSRRGAG